MTDEVLRWALGGGPRAVLAAARLRLERGHRGPRVQLQIALSADDRREVGRVLGVEWQTSGRPVTLGQLRAGLERAGAGLEEVLIVTGGPLEDQAGRRTAERTARERRIEEVRASLLAAGVAPAAADLALDRRWIGAPIDGAFGERAGQLARLWTALTGRRDGGTPRLLAELASDVFSDPHALDRDRALGRLAARLLAAQEAVHAGTDLAAAAAGALAAGAWRSTWAGVGIACDTVSSTVLVLNLSLAGAAPVVALTGAARRTGEPLWLTSRVLVGRWTAAAGLGTVRVCENPSVIEAAADQLGARCPPLVCTYGRPSVAAWTLLGGLVQGGAAVLVSADRDDAGDQIAAQLLRDLPGAGPWGVELFGRYEEDRLPGLLADLARAAG